MAIEDLLPKVKERNGETRAAFRNFIDNKSYEADRILEERMYYDETITLFFNKYIIAGREERKTSVGLTLHLLENESFLEYDEPYLPVPEKKIQGKFLLRLKKEETFLSNTKSRLESYNKTLYDYIEEYSKMYRDEDSQEKIMIAASLLHELLYMQAEYEDNRRRKPEGLTTREQGEIFRSQDKEKTEDKPIKKMSMQELQNALEKGIRNERYLRCAKIRDEIKSRNS